MGRGLLGRENPLERGQGTVRKAHHFLRVVASPF
jgi:hypothetical protein